ncbi:MAG: DUF502 domain-containing protein [Nevskiales bacterium]
MTDLSPASLWGRRGAIAVLLRKWAIAGLVVWIPLGVTLLVLRFFIKTLDASLLLIPAAIRPDIPGLGILLSLVLVLGTGALAANFIGGQLLQWAEELLDRVPLVRSIYSGMKKLAETLFSKGSASFRQPILIQYPCKGVWSVAFITGQPIPEAEARIGKKLVTVYVPTTPNPTSGFVVLVPADEVVHLDMSVEAAMNLIISLGVVTPESKSLGQL